MTLQETLAAIRARASANDCAMSVGVVLRRGENIVSFEVTNPTTDVGAVSVAYQARKAFEELGIDAANLGAPS